LSFFDGDLSRIDKIYTLNLKLYYYYYNVKASFEDDRVTVSKKKDFKGVSAHRAGQSMGVPRIYIRNGGWHFSYLGGLEQVRTKIQNFGHSELNTVVVMDRLEENFRRLEDPYGRIGCVYTVVPIDQGYPEYFLNNLGKYRSNIYNDMKK
jgi:beta-1,4-mannosyl-glycoprotein beta-1,4-N-acetylglucosaminyltransferase